MAVWRLETGGDFTAFCFPLEDEKLFFQELVKDYFEEFKPVSASWKPLHLLRAEPMKFPDFFEIDNTDIIAISQKAVEVLQPFFKKVELLPIETDAGNYYALNVLNFVDCLNKKASDYVATQNGTIVSYNLLELYEIKIEDFSIFRLPELPYQVFITHDIGDQCEQHELRGLEFDPKSNLVWFPE